MELPLETEVEPIFTKNVYLQIFHIYFLNTQISTI